MRPYYARNWYLEAKKLVFERPRKVEKKILIFVSTILIFYRYLLVTDILASKLSKNLNVYEVYEKQHNIIPRLFLNANSCVGISL